MKRACGSPADKRGKSNGHGRGPKRQKGSSPLLAARQAARIHLSSEQALHLVYPDGNCSIMATWVAYCGMRVLSYEHVDVKNLKQQLAEYVTTHCELVGRWKARPLLITQQHFC